MIEALPEVSLFDLNYPDNLVRFNKKCSVAYKTRKKNLQESAISRSKLYQVAG